MEDNTKKTIVATVGIFDGVHAGHRYLINQLKAIAEVEHAKSLVVTFAVHPRKVLSADFHPELLNTLSQKISLLKATGIDRCEVLEFSIQMSKLSAYDFLKQILIGKYGVTTLLVGHDHRFGHNRAEGFDDYVRYGEMLGIEVIQASRFITSEHESVCSSAIREALHRGNMETVNTLLTNPYSLAGRVTNGFKVGRKIGFPTANIQPNDAEKIIPPIGVYAVRIRINQVLLDGMMNIGTRPTLANGNQISLEVNIFDFDETIYNQTIEVFFIKKIRDEKKFNGVDELIAQLNEDKLNVKEVIIDFVNSRSIDC